jgi:hypothetical protein
MRGRDQARTVAVWWLFWMRRAVDGRRCWLWCVGGSEVVDGGVEVEMRDAWTPW